MRLQAIAGHADRIGNAKLIVHNIFLRKDVNDFAAGWNGYSLGCFDNALDISRIHFLAVLEGNGSMRVGPLDVTARDACVN